ncbi:MAG: AEC family transporter, partial [Clostridiales bacterium]|nr:AEC family transporter [Clostridiales bacterium]
MTIGTVFFQMLSLAILILVGVVISRIKMVDDHGMGQISRLINYVFNPMLMVSSAIDSVGSIDKQVMLLLFGLAAVLYLALILIGRFAAPLFDKRPGQKEMYQLMFIFSNVGFMGIPVIRGVFGAENVV